ncbi:methyltransferase [Neorhodopirellula pilleata]|uniref:Carminomycin 4-O-methyltransferase n=1 Tax=Neorhodopirellula pilleata TaxID=2714738 RepID=A0A5C6AHD2_9BACT|nr:methyltransferase [Neorhodopirellula pilleata]TWT98826.1 Carminomycin 4-O-methyltransferase [Neorhodopirellula pilleata]
MFDLTQPPASDPSVILRYRDRQYAADLIAAAILEFDLFTWIDQHSGVTLANLCEHFGWQSRPADVLMTLCRASGFVRTDPSGHCELTEVGREYLVADSPWFLGPYYQPIADSPKLHDYVQILKTGKPANWQAKADGADWHESMKDPAFAKSFTELMNCRGIAFGQKLAESLAAEMHDRKHLLDVGGGSGIYSATMVSRYPQLRATVLEQPPVDVITRSEVERWGLSDRIAIHSADMFTDPWSSDTQHTGIDTILLSNVLHDWDWSEANEIIRRTAETLPSGGLLIIHDAIINADKTGPLPVAEYSSLLMNITQGKCYSVTEYAEMVAMYGLEVTRNADTTGDRGFVIAVKS